MKAPKTSKTSKASMFGMNPDDTTVIGLSREMIPWLISAVVEQRVTWVEGSNLTEFDYLGFRYRIEPREDGRVKSFEKIARVEVWDEDLFDDTFGESEGGTVVVEDLVKARAEDESPEFGSW